MTEAPPPPPRTEGSFPWFIVALAVVVAILGVSTFLVAGLTSSRSSNDRNAFASLKTLVTAEADFRSNDRDGNLRNQYWVGDVRGLWDIIPEKGSDPVKLVELSVAYADACPAAIKGVRRSVPGSTASPKSGYLFAVIPLMADGKPYDDGSGCNDNAYAFCCWPAKSPGVPRWTFIVNEDATIWKKDNGGTRVLRWPADPKAEGWVKAD